MVVNSYLEVFEYMKKCVSYNWETVFLTLCNFTLKSHNSIITFSLAKSYHWFWSRVYKEKCMWWSSNLNPSINQTDRFVKSWRLIHSLISYEDLKMKPRKWLCRHKAIGALIRAVGNDVRERLGPSNSEKMCYGCLRFWVTSQIRKTSPLSGEIIKKSLLKYQAYLTWFSFQELIDVDSEVVFELASYILQVSCFPPSLYSRAIHRRNRNKTPHVWQLL